MWFSPALLAQHPGVLGLGELDSDTGNEAADWPGVMVYMRPTSTFLRDESMAALAIDAEWASLAKAAQRRWLAENPF